MTTTERTHRRHRRRAIAAVVILAAPLTACDSASPSRPPEALASSTPPEGAVGPSVVSSRPTLRRTSSPAPTKPRVRRTPVRVNGIPAVWLRLAHCESTSRWGYRGLHHGGLQFAPGTWAAFRSAGEPRFAYLASPVQQVGVGKRVLRAQGVSAWPSCGPKVGLRLSDAA